MTAHSRHTFRSSSAIKGGLLLGCMAAFLGGCVSQDEYKGVQTALEQSQMQLAKADHDLQEARDQIKALNDKITALNLEIEANKGSSDALQKLRDLYEKQLADLQQKYNDLLKISSTPALPAPVNAALRELAAQYPQYLEFDERLGMLRMKSDVTFDVGSTEVKPEAKKVLTLVAQILNKPEISKNEVQVVGYTDDIPIRAGGPMATRNPDNWTLSTNRAWAVLDVLRNAGLAADRGMGAGWREERPIADNAPGHRGNEKNRRVEIYIRPTLVPEELHVSTPGAAAPAPVRRSTPAATPPATPPANRGSVEIPR